MIAERGSGLKPIIKWAGGKEKELDYILSNIPTAFDNYYEPFIGGGSVFMSINAKKYFINDLSTELISLYRNIAIENPVFFNYIEQINKSWHKTLGFLEDHLNLIDVYLKYRNNIIDDRNLKSFILEFCNGSKEDIVDILCEDFYMAHEIMLSEMHKNLFRKVKRMKALELSKHTLPEKDIFDNIETAIKSACYMYFRHLYNDKNLCLSNPLMHCALFFFIRNYCYSGMFRYNINGDFNVPYGGMAYNSKTLDKKIEYYHSKGLQDHFVNTDISNFDFEVFLRKKRPQKNDFIFLDPPYDSEFSTYAQNEFTKEDHCRLADFMMNECNSKWMMVIKYTDFIYSLYNGHGLNIRAFDKEYIVSFMNRNDKKVTHLLITNY